MAILDRFKKKPAAKKPATKKAPKAAAKTEAASSAPNAMGKGSLLSSTLLLRPHVSEKAARLADRGTYVFQVARQAEKVSIAKAVESLYGVKVEGVRIVNISGKPVRKGKRVSSRQDLKKALVTLKKGETIALYEGV